MKKGIESFDSEIKIWSRYLEFMRQLYHKERTNLENIYLEQFSFFGDENRIIASNEAVYDKQFAMNNFQKKILELNVLERLEKKFTRAQNKAPYLYKFKR